MMFILRFVAKQRFSLTAPDNYLVNILPHLNVHDKFITPPSHDQRFISFFNLRQETLVYLTEVPSYCKCPIHRPPQFDLEYARPCDRPTWSGPSCSKHVKSLKPTMNKLPVLTKFLDSGKSPSDSNQTYSCFFITTTPQNLIDPYYDFESNLGDIEFTSDETFSEDNRLDMVRLSFLLSLSYLYLIGLLLNST